MFGEAGVISHLVPRPVAMGQNYEQGLNLSRKIMEETVLARVHMSKAAVPKTVQVCFLDLNMYADNHSFQFHSINFLTILES